MQKYPCVIDGLEPGKFTVEAKCPYVLRDLDPRDPNCLDKLKKNQRDHLCLEKCSDGLLRLKRDHPYFIQCQTQMFLCDVPDSFFVV